MHFSTPPCNLIPRASRCNATGLFIEREKMRKKKTETIKAGTFVPKKNKSEIELKFSDFKPDNSKEYFRSLALIYAAKNEDYEKNTSWLKAVIFIMTILLIIAIIK